MLTLKYWRNIGNAIAKVAQICLNVYRKKYRDSTNINPLIEQFNSCYGSTMMIDRNYFTEKSQNKMTTCTNFFGDAALLTTVFSNKQPYHEFMDKI